MVQIRDRQIVIDGKPRLLLAGEIHYFRLQRADWEDRIQKAKDLGCNAIASYIPWLVHEPEEGDFDLIGRDAPENDLGAYIDLCAKHDLFFIARPGPFVMAEMKHEGIPAWMYRNHPDVVPQTWDGQKAHGAVVQYLSPTFLKLAQRWYGKVMPLLAARLQPQGGPVVAVQLDNEIGMLAWAGNEPDLGEETLCEFAEWLGNRYPKGELAKRYPFKLTDPWARRKAMQTPESGYALAFMRDYGDFRRDQIARYVAHLRTYAENAGVREVPFIVNIHGSGGGRGTQFPIGIHHTYKAYTQAPGYLGASDHYLGDLGRQNGADLYVLNAFMRAAARPEQPLASMEFEVGNGDYGETGSVRYGATAADLKVLLSLAQGNRLINYYLLAGGRNPLLRDRPGDGNDRVSFTGERHGFAAPISPEGALDPTYLTLQQMTKSVLTRESDLATCEEELDAVDLVFLPDAYKTDVSREGNMRKIISSLEESRDTLDDISRALLALGFRFSAINLQASAPDPRRALVYAGSPYMDAKEQEALARYVEQGGRLLICFRIPWMDMEGQVCTVLSDRLGIHPDKFLQSETDFTLAIKGEDWAASEPEVSRWQVQSVAVKDPSKVFLRTVQTKLPCGVEGRAGEGTAVFLGTAYAFHPPFYRELFGRLGLRPVLQHNDATLGMLCTTARCASGARYLFALNLDLETKTVVFREGHHALFEGKALAFNGRQARLEKIGG